MIRHLQATRPDRIFAEGGLFACGYTRNAGGYIVSCWNDDGNQPGRPVIFTGVTGAAEKIDLSATSPRWQCKRASVRSS